MYESMLSSLPLYSVWPHLRRMMTSVPTLRNGLENVFRCNLLVIRCDCDGAIKRQGTGCVPSLEERPGVDRVELDSQS